MTRSWSFEVGIDAFDLDAVGWAIAQTDADKMPSDGTQFEPPQASVPIGGYMAPTDELEQTLLGVHGRRNQTGADRAGNREDLR